VITFYFDKEHKTGTWRYLRTIYNGLKATIICPMCGQYGSLEDHSIAEDGAVTPSVVCPNENCSFHENILLDGWKNE
jgi:hypothetical protein